MTSDATGIPTPSALTREIGVQFAAVALHNIAQEYPHKLDHVMSSDGDAVPPRVLHPAFHSSYDWHSCVHMHWLLVHLRRHFPDLPQKTVIDAVMSSHFSPGAIADECAYFDRPDARSFERPYGWAWLLELARELRTCDDPLARAWSDALAPLASLIEARYLDFLPRADYPVRYGMHSNSAFGLLFALDYAHDQARIDVVGACRAKALAWYGNDVDAPAQWEPSGADFLSPSLVEAMLMSRVHEAADFESWLSRFLPDLAQAAPRTLFAPARVSDRTDPQIVHLDGLNLSRAWCLYEIASALPVADARVDVLRKCADDHLHAGMAALSGGAFVAAHWLASFAALALRARNG